MKLIELTAFQYDGDSKDAVFAQEIHTINPAQIVRMYTEEVIRNCKTVGYRNVVVMTDGAHLSVIENPTAIKNRIEKTLEL